MSLDFKDPKVLTALGAVLRTHIPHWVELENRAKAAFREEKPIVKVKVSETDSYRKPLQGVSHDVWKIEGGICFKKRPTLLEIITGFLATILYVILTPVRALQRGIEKLILAVSSKLNVLGSLLSIPFSLLLVVFDFCTSYLVNLLSALSQPGRFIRLLISLPFWFLKTLAVRLIEALMAPFLAKMLDLLEKAQDKLVAFLEKNKWLRAILLGLIRSRTKPNLPIIIPQSSISEVFVKETRGLFGKKSYLVVVEGEKIVPGLVPSLILKLKQSIFPYYWERTVHSLLLPKKGTDEAVNLLKSSLNF